MEPKREGGERRGRKRKKELRRLRGWVVKTIPGKEEDWRIRKRKEVEGR